MQQPTNKILYQPKKKSGRFITVLLVIGAAITLAVILNHQGVYDWLRLRDYAPPENIAALAGDDTLTDGARRAFYVNHPVVQSKADFAKSCPNGNKETAVLGCYIPNQRGIYVLHVTDTRLAGIEQVTAAHEILHAEYDRLSRQDKNQVDGWLMDYYQHGLHDQTIKAQLESYKKTEPNDLVNEMHSIFGTQIAGLPPSLENYYKRYFTDRSKITNYYSTYQAEFTSRQLQIKLDDANLADLKKQIAIQESDLKAQQSNLAAQQTRINSERASGNVSGYNAGVPAYNAAVNDYNRGVSSLQSLIAQYNQLVEARNSLALEEQQLVQDISSHVSPLDKQ